MTGREKSCWEQVTFYVFLVIKPIEKFSFLLLQQTKCKRQSINIFYEIFLSIWFVLDSFPVSRTSIKQKKIRKKFDFWNFCSEKSCLETLTQEQNLLSLKSQALIEAIKDLFSLPRTKIWYKLLQKARFQDLFGKKPASNSVNSAVAKYLRDVSFPVTVVQIWNKMRR